MGLGTWLTRWRNASRLTQAEVSRRTGIVQHQISRLEHDQIERPSMQDVVKIVQVYGVTPNEVAEKVYGWVPPKEFKAEDYRWQFLKDFLNRADSETRDRLMQEIYDKAIWYDELAKEKATV